MSEFADRVRKKEDNEKKAGAKKTGARSGPQIDQIDLSIALMAAALAAVVIFSLIIAFTGIDVKDDGVPVEETGEKTAAEEKNVPEETSEHEASGDDPSGLFAPVPVSSGEADASVSEGVSDTSGLQEGEDGSAGSSEGESGDPFVGDESPELMPGTVHAVSDGEIEVIRTSYDGTVRGFGIGLEGGGRDSFNRQLQAVNIESRMKAIGANVLVFASDEETPELGLVFQAGYEAGHTEKILDILKENDIPATFFVTMEYVTKNPDIVRRMITEGHEIGSHTSSAPDDGIANASLEEQMTDALELQEYVEQNFGYTMTKYNFNSGVYSEQQAVLMSKMGYCFTFCSLNYDDYDPEQQFDAEEVMASLEDKLHNGCILCFHMTNTVTEEILPELIDDIREKNYTVVSLR